MFEFLFALHCSVGRLFLLLVLGVLVPLVSALFLQLLGPDRLRSRGQSLLLGERVDSVVFVSEIQVRPLFPGMFSHDVVEDDCKKVWS